MRAKKVLSILFALALVLSSLPASAIAESIEDAGKYSVVVSYVNVLNDEEILPSPTRSFTRQTTVKFLQLQPKLRQSVLLSANGLLMQLIAETTPM